MAREEARAEAHSKSEKSLKQTLSKKLGVAQKDLTTIEFTPDAAAMDKRKAGAIALSHDRVFKDIPKNPRGRKAVKERDLFEKEIAAIAQILNHYGLLDKMSYREQEELLSAIVAVLKRYAS